MSFFDELIMALENDENVDPKLEKAAGTGTPYLFSEEEANDKTGNPDSPGDDGSPIGSEDDDFVKEVNSEAEATDKSGNPGVPGDGDGTADPVSLEGAALELFGAHKSDLAAQYSDEECVKKFIASIANTIDKSSERKQEFKTAIDEYYKLVKDDKSLTVSLVTISGCPVVVTRKTADKSIIDVQWRVNGAKRNTVYGMKRIRLEVTKMLKKEAKNKPANEGLFGPSKSSMAAVANLSGNALIKKFIETLQAEGVKINPDKGVLNEIRAEDLQDGTADKASIVNMNGVSVLVEVKDGASCIVYLVEGKKVSRVATEDRMRKRVAKAMDKANESKPASESIGLPRFMRDAMEEAIDLPGVPETKVTTDVADVEKSIGIHKKNNLIPIASEKDAQDESGNTGTPGDEGNPVSKSGDTKELPENKFEKVSNDDSGNSDDPGDDGDSVSKSGDAKDLPENKFEKVANDKTGNAVDPGVNGNPATSFESFINTCESMMTKRPNDGSIYIPENLTLEQYATMLGYGEILDRAMESKMTAAERRALRDDQFGLPSKRKYPLHDKEHVSDAIAYFRFCPPEDRDELARNIIKAIRKFHMEVTITKGNPFEKYYPKAKVVSPRKKGSTGATAAHA